MWNNLWQSRAVCALAGAVVGGVVVTALLATLRPVEPLSQTELRAQCRGLAEDVLETAGMIQRMLDRSEMPAPTRSGAP